ncbi:hypothetical protein SNE40_011197 [Patella caerulea]|uniref:Uncharacterized protein n=1 Tax=Patella caerulea TaxID=87958 RepID=A0AAN8JNL5_PATCE
MNTEMVWYHWERQLESDGKVRKNLLTKNGTVREAVEELISDVTKPVQGSSFFKHAFQGNWQQNQFLSLKSNLPIDVVLMVVDFGKNRNIHHQDQAKSDYFASKQATVHPVVMFYRSKDIPDLTVRDAMVFVNKRLET